jgi:putative ABC transport system permease protein
VTFRFLRYKIPLAAYPIAWFGISTWLESFAEKISVSPIIYFVSSLLALAIGWFSIFYQALKAARYNPAEAMRYK